MSQPSLSDLFGDEFSDWHNALHEAVRGTYGRDETLPAELGIVEVVACAAGDNDAANWEAIFRLSDGEYAYLNAGCDNTGWDCCASGSFQRAPDLETLCRMVLDEDARQRLSFDVFGKRVHQ